MEIGKLTGEVLTAYMCKTIRLCIMILEGGHEHAFSFRAVDIEPKELAYNQILEDVV